MFDAPIHTHLIHPSPLANTNLTGSGPDDAALLSPSLASHYPQQAHHIRSSSGYASIFSGLAAHHLLRVCASLLPSSLLSYSFLLSRFSRHAQIGLSLPSLPLSTH